MTLPTVFANLGTATGAQLDGNFNTLGEFAVIPCAITGTNTLVLAPASNTPTISGYSNYMVFSGVVAANNTGAVTANVASLGALQVYRDAGSGPTALVGGELRAGNYVEFAYDSTLNSGAGGLHLVNVTYATANIIAGPGIGVVLNSGTVTVSQSETINTTTLVNYTLTAADAGAMLDQHYGGTSGNIVVNAGSAAGFVADLWAQTNSFISANSGTIYQGAGTLTGANALELAPGQVAKIVSFGTNFVVAPYSPFGQYRKSSAGGAVLSYPWTMDLNPNTPSTFTGSGALSIGPNGTIANYALAVGFGNSVGSESAAVGLLNVGTGGSNLLNGTGGYDFGVTNCHIHANGANTANATQIARLVLRGTGSGTGAIRATCDGSTASATNTGVMAAQWGGGFSMVATVIDATNKGVASFTGANANSVNMGLIFQGGSLASTAISSGFSLVHQDTLGSIAALGSITVAADTTFGGFNVSYTPGIGNTASMLLAVHITNLQAT